MKCKDTLQKIKQKVQEIIQLVDEFEEEDCPGGEDSLLGLPDDFQMETTQVRVGDIDHTPFDPNVGNNRWMSETINGAYFSVNAWGFGGNAGGTQELEDAYVSIYKEDDLLKFDWWVGGYWNDFSGNPADGWWTPKKGGNDVKAYPRVGIGSASGQEVATVGAPFNVPCKRTDGWKHVDQNAIKARCGLPERLAILPNIDIHIDFQMKSSFGNGKDKYGNYFLAVDSYLHDVDDRSRVSIPTLQGRNDGINDTSGSIYNQPMSSLPKTTKEWAIMIWLAKSPYFETSGGTVIGSADIDGHTYIIKYKIETASDKKFKYISFTRDVDATKINEQSGVINYNAFVDFYTSPSMNTIFRSAGALEDLDGLFRVIEAPKDDLVLSDINFGIETLCNPDIPNQSTTFPVTCEFKKLCFDVQGKGKFGFEA